MVSLLEMGATLETRPACCLSWVAPGAAVRLYCTATRSGCGGLISVELCRVWRPYFGRAVPGVAAWFLASCAGCGGLILGEPCRVWWADFGRVKAAGDRPDSEGAEAGAVHRQAEPPASAGCNAGSGGGAASKVQVRPPCPLLWDRFARLAEIFETSRIASR